jgi:hypothetical protein
VLLDELVPSFLDGIAKSRRGVKVGADRDAERDLKLHPYPLLGAPR